MAAGKTHTWTPARKAKFLEALRRTRNVSAAARLVRGSRSGVHDARAKDPKFAAAWDEVWDEVVDLAEARAANLAIDGIKRPVLHQGKQVILNGKPLFEVEYDRALLARLVAKGRPERWSEPEISVEGRVEHCVKGYLPNMPIGDDQNAP